MSDVVVFHAISCSDVRRELEDQGITANSELIDAVMDQLDILAKLEVDEGTRDEWVSEVITDALEEIDYEEINPDKVIITKDDEEEE
jgi:hypothetical protein